MFNDDCGVVWSSLNDPPLSRTQDSQDLGELQIRHRSIIPARSSLHLRQLTTEGGIVQQDRLIGVLGHPYPTMNKAVGFLYGNHSY